MRLIVAVIALFLSAQAYAAPVIWSIDSLIFSDGGTASGSFTYDAVTNVYSDISVITTAGSVLDGATYSFLNPSPFSPPNPSGLALVTSDNPDLTGTPGIGLSFELNLTDAGGTIQLTGFLEGFCSNAECNAPIGPTRNLLSGQISAVPVPAAVWLFGSALAGLGWLRRVPANKAR